MSTGRPKALLKQAKGKKKKEQVLEDADDYLAAAVDDEDAMGKHRGGDAVKSLRFARKALDLYSQGLSKYSKNFDLAYNKARLELEVATHPTLVKALDVPVTDVLQQALTSHRYALSLEPENADTLFNTAQVLTTIAEYIAKDDTIPDNEALQYLEEALEHQARCLQTQETKFTESRQFHEAAMNQSVDDDEHDQDQDHEDEDGGAKLDPTTKSAFEDREEQQQQEQWVSIVEPVTAGTLVDTILSQLSTLTTLCTILTSTLTSSNTPGANSRVSPSWIESYSSKLVTQTLPSLTTSNNETLSSRSSEIHRTKAIFICSLLDLAFHTGDISPETYIAELNTTFINNANDTPPDPETSIAHARALITYNASLADPPPPSTTTQTTTTASSLPTHRWTALSQATNLLTSTAQTLGTSKTNAHDPATTHLLRGDIALLMYALSQPPIQHTPAVTNATQLLKNAEVFYRNATKLFGTVPGGDGVDESAVSAFRGGVVVVLKRVADVSGSQRGIAGVGTATPEAMGVLQGVSVGRNDVWRREQLVEMVDEGLVGGEVFGM